MMPDCGATLLPAAVLLLRDVTEDVLCTSVVCTIIVTLISCLLCHKLVTDLYMLCYILVDIMMFPITDLVYNYLSHSVKIKFTTVKGNLMTKVHCEIKKRPNLWEPKLYFIFSPLLLQANDSSVCFLLCMCMFVRVALKRLLS
jgi:hypothetical protein